jgi:hypothetical protein
MNLADQALEISILVEDVSENGSSLTTWLASSTNEEIATAFATALAQKFEAASDAKVGGLDLTWRSALVPFPSPTSGNLSFHHACLFFRTDGGDEAVLALPAAKDAVFQADGLMVDPLHPAIADIIAAMRDGMGGVHPIAVPSGADLTSYIEGYKQERY